jgi:hypothetical protein
MEILTEEPVVEDASDRVPREPAALIAAFRDAIAAGAPWFEALLTAVRDWSAPLEIVDERRYCYLIGGEAFDWLTLAERLIEAAGERIPAEEAEALLFAGQLPPGYDDDAFRRAIGPTKHRLHRNYFYGISVEEALQLSFEEDVQKEGRCRAWGGDARADESAFERIYFKTKDELLARFRHERGLPYGEALAFDDLKAFTYWLFKYRLQACDPAKVASDTGRGLARLAALDGIRNRRPAPETPPAPARTVEAYAL